MTRACTLLMVSSMWPLTTSRSCRPSRSTSKKKQPKPSVWRVARPISRPRRHVGVLAAADRLVEPEHLPGEVRDHDRGLAGVVDVGRVDAHAGARPALLAEREPGLQTELGEGAVAVVAIQLVRLRVVGDEHVRPRVEVVVEQRDAERLRGRVEQTRLRRHVLERAVALVAEQPRRRAAIGLRRAVRLLLAVHAAEDVGLGRPADVVADEQVEPAVAVVVEPERRRAEALAVAEARLRGDVDEAPLPVLRNRRFWPTAVMRMSCQPSLS